MKKIKKALLLVTSAGALVAASVLGTMAYLTSTDTVANTFTVGNVNILLDELDVDKTTDTDNTDITTGEGTDTQRDRENKYHLLPGHTYVKDPTVTVQTGSEDSYVRMMVKVEGLDDLKNAMPKNEFPEFYNEDIFLLQMLCVDENDVSTWENTKWEFETFHNADDAKYPNTYEFRYYTTANEESGPQGDGVLESLFGKITVPGKVNNEQLAHLGNVNIVVTAHAIQADGFDDADDAWKAFD